MPTSKLPFDRKALALVLGAALAVLLAAGAVAWLKRPAPSPARAAIQPVSSQGTMPCEYHVMIIHDVHWAAACMKNAPPDDEADCMLPPERAAALNAAQEEAERFCRRRG